jgi:hypothetical protein
MNWFPNNERIARAYYKWQEFTSQDQLAQVDPDARQETRLLERLNAEVILAALEHYGTDTQATKSFSRYYQLDQITTGRWFDMIESQLEEV